MEPFCLCLTTYYIILRYNLLNTELKVQARRKRQLCPMYLYKLLLAHQELAVIVNRYNKRWSWSTFTSYVILMPIFALNVFGVFFLSNMPFFVSIFMSILLFNHFLILIVSLGMSSWLNASAFVAYRSFSTLAISNGLLMNYRFGLKLQLWLKTVAEKKVGYWLLDFYPITYCHVGKASKLIKKLQEKV